MQASEETFTTEVISDGRATAKASQSSPPTTKQINVTDLTPSQQRKLFTDCLNQEGFVGFIKKKIGKQTYYTFTYENYV
jgi:hypothetical protein